MAEPDDLDEVRQFNRLLKLAQSQDQASRRIVFENMTRRGITRVVKPEVVSQVMNFYGPLPQQRVRMALRYWRADRDYVHASAKLAETGMRAS